MEYLAATRRTAPAVPTGPVRVRRPPEISQPQPANPLARLLPVVMLVAAAGMVLLYVTGPNTSTARSPMYLMLPVMMLVSVLGTVAHGARGRSAEVETARREYLRYLDGVDADAAQTAHAQRARLSWEHPEPAALWTLAGGPRMWERRPDHPEFCRVRTGLGPVPLATPLLVDGGDRIAEPDPVTETALDELLANRSVVPMLPVTVDLAGRIGVTGQPAAVRDLVRAMVCQLATLHSPAHLRIAARGAPALWDWLKWLPHHHGRRPPGATWARSVLILDGADDGGDGADIVLDLGGRGDHIIEAGTGSDALTEVQAQRCARRLARWSAGGDVGTGIAPAWSELLDTGAVRDPRDADFLQVPIGIGDGVENRGAPVCLDLKEAARGGVGPHGLCVGATGSGKSEFLRTLILGLAVTHRSEDLNLALVDFKGGATFLGFERLPHVAAVITNLAEEQRLVDRMRDALTGEMHRRQQQLRDAGVGSVTEYRAARAARSDLAMLPVLLIVIDEFSELLSLHPEFAELFVAVGRLGRSLGMHLLLASQRLDEGRLRGLETHLSYRVCLKTFSTADSRAVLGVPDAYELPAKPGAAFLKTADGQLVRLHTAYVSGPEVVAVPAVVPHVFTAQAPVPPCINTAQTPLHAALDRLAGHGTRAHPIWLAPLPGPPTLQELLNRHRPDRLVSPIGLVDNPFAQRRDLHTVNFNGAGGHLGVVGATRSGKSTVLRTLMTGLAVGHGPDDIQFYCLDFGGGALEPMRELPHTGVVAGPDDTELVRRTIAQLQAVIRRRAAATARPHADGYGEVFLVVDGWATLRRLGDGLEEDITAMAAHGLAHGVHIVLTAARWAELRPALKDQLGSRIELRLGEPAESEMDRKAARHLVDAPPGTAVTRDGRLSALATPHLDGEQHTALRSRCPGRVAAPVRLLPAMLDRGTLPVSRASATSVVIGVEESELTSAVIDFAECGHLMVLGDMGCGKTAVLRTLCAQLVDTCAPDAVQLYLADVRRTLLGVVDTDHLAGYAISATIMTEQLAGLVDTLRSRLPGAAVTQRQLRERSWWSGPEIYVLVDDYELLAGGLDPLAPLLELLPYARDIGLHLVLARRAGGAGRALFNPVPALLRELGSAGLLMSAGPDEGALLGATRPTTLPPGRATLIRRGRPDERIQIAWTEPR